MDGLDGALELGADSLRLVDFTEAALAENICRFVVFVEVSQLLGLFDLLKILEVLHIGRVRHPPIHFRQREVPRRLICR